jgi:hypothetical protein
VLMLRSPLQQPAPVLTVTTLIKTNQRQCRYSSFQLLSLLPKSGLEMHKPAQSQFPPPGPLRGAACVDTVLHGHSLYSLVLSECNF